MSNTVTTDYLDDKLEKSFSDFSSKLFGYLDKRFDEVSSRIDQLDEKYDKLMVTLDAFLKRLDDIEADNHARDAQIARLERWIETIAKKTGVKLEY